MTVFLFSTYSIIFTQTLILFVSNINVSAFVYLKMLENIKLTITWYHYSGFPEEGFLPLTDFSETQRAKWSRTVLNRMCRFRNCHFMLVFLLGFVFTWQTAHSLSTRVWLKHTFLSEPDHAFWVSTGQFWRRLRIMITRTRQTDTKPKPIKTNTNNSS